MVDDYSNRLRMFLVAARFPFFEQHISRGELWWGPRNERDEGTQRGAIIKCFDELKQLSPEQLEQLASHAREEMRTRMQYASEFLRSVPDLDPQYLAAEFEWWSHQPFWTAEEAAALVLNADPRRCRADQMARYADHHPFAAKFVDVCNLIERAQQCGELGHQIFPHDFVRWADAGRLELPLALVERVRAAPPCAKSLSSRVKELEQEVSELKSAESQPLHGKERTTLARIVLTYAVGLGYDPENSRNSTATQISAACTRLGYPVSDDTVRDTLKKCKDWARSGRT